MTIVADAAPGLAPGSSIWVAGRPVGRVLSVRLRPPEADRADHVVVRAVLHRSAEGVIREDASATIRAADLLEPMIVSVDPGSPGRPPLDLSDTLRASEERIDPERMRALADTLRRAGRDLTEGIEEVRRALAERRGTLARLREDPRPVEELVAGMRSATDLMGRFETGTLGRLARDSTLAERAARIRERFAAITRTAPGQETEGESLRGALARLDGLGDRIARLSAAVERGEGTAGRALADRELPRQLALLQARLDSAVAELARSPGRWLRVRIF